MTAKAICFAAEKHAGQFRKYKNAAGVIEPYINHPLRVMQIANSAVKKIPLTMADLEIVPAVAVLHDVVEDCGVRNQELAELFDAEVCNGVWWLTKASMSPILKDLPRIERREADLKKIKQAPQVFQIIKLADRLDNVRGMRFGPRDFVLNTYFPETVALLNALENVAPELVAQILREIDSVKTSLLKDLSGGS